MMQQQWILNNPHVCVLPYSVHHMQVEFDGQRDLTKQTTTFRNSCCCNLALNSVLDASEELAADVKKSMSLKQLNPRCYRCHDSENQTGVSERTMALMSMSPEQMTFFVETLRPQEFTVRIKFSNLCNLACRSCSPTFSSRYAQVHELQVPRSLTDDIGEIPEHWNYITDKFESYLKKYKFINLCLLGGESLIQPGAIKLLQWLEDQGVLGRINLSITTNLTNLNTKVIAWLPKFNKLHVSASLDSVHTNFEYVRWPANFQTVIDNLFKLDLLQTNALDITIQPLINLNNLFYINDTLDFWNSVAKTIKHNIQIDPVVMHRPYHMTVQNLPLEYRLSAQDVLYRAINHQIWTAGHYKLLDYIKGLYRFVCSDQQVYDQFELYLFDTVRHDRANTTLMSIGNEKFYDLLSEKHKSFYNECYNNTIPNLLPLDQQKIYWNLPL